MGSVQQPVVDGELKITRHSAPRARVHPPVGEIDDGKLRSKLTQPLDEA